MSPHEHAARRAERDREAARDAISAGCATPDEWALVTGQVDALRGGVFAERARAAHRQDRWSLMVAMRGRRPEAPPMGDLPASVPLPREWVRTRWDAGFCAAHGLVWDLGGAA